MSPNIYKELNAPELVSQWKRLVNGEVLAGRDAHMLRKAMDEHGWTPVQILLGFYYIANSSASMRQIPSFIKYYDLWLHENAFEAELLLAKKISDSEPDCWSSYWDLLDPGIDNASWEKKFEAAKRELQEWSDRILSQPVRNRRIKA